MEIINLKDRGTKIEEEWASFRALGGTISNNKVTGTEKKVKEKC